MMMLLLLVLVFVLLFQFLFKAKMRNNFLNSFALSQLSQGAPNFVWGGEWGDRPLCPCVSANGYLVMLHLSCLALTNCQAHWYVSTFCNNLLVLGRSLLSGAQLGHLQLYRRNFTLCIMLNACLGHTFFWGGD